MKQTRIWQMNNEELSHSHYPGNNAPKGDLNRNRALRGLMRDVLQKTRTQPEENPNRMMLKKRERQGARES